MSCPRGAQQQTRRTQRDRRTKRTDARQLFTYTTRAVSIICAQQTSYRPGGGETICPRRWQFDPKIVADLRQVRNPHISCGRRWLSCRQPVCLQPRQLRHGTDRRTDRLTDGSRYSKMPPRAGGIIPCHLFSMFMLSCAFAVHS